MNVRDWPFSVADHRPPWTENGFSDPDETKLSPKPLCQVVVGGGFGTFDGQTRLLQELPQAAPADRCENWNSLSIFRWRPRMSPSMLRP